MAKQKTAQILTAVILALVVSAIAIRQSLRDPSGAKRDKTPQDAIYAMLDAAREGDVDSYVDFYTGQIRATLDQAVEEQGEGGFASYLRESNAPIKGIAITEPERLSPTEAKARVEYVYQDRNEVQFMYLRMVNGAWRIERVDQTQRIKTVVPYGTPVE